MNSARPSIADMARMSMRFEHLAIHVVDKDRPFSEHALLLFDKRGWEPWLARASLCFPSIQIQSALRILFSHELQSNKFRLAFNLAHGLDDEALTPPEDTELASQYEGLGYGPDQPGPPCCAGLRMVEPSRLGNPSYRDLIRVDHLHLSVGATQGDFSSVDFQGLGLPQPQGNPMGVANAIAKALGPMLGRSILSGHTPAEGGSMDPRSEELARLQRAALLHGGEINLGAQRQRGGGGREGLPKPLTIEGLGQCTGNADSTEASSLLIAVS